jgi:hypothetical protein
MNLIAHRGLFNGPNSSWENRPEQILLALKNGFDAEVDVRVIDGEIFLGHDRPDYKVDKDFIEQPGLWLHAKNLEALSMLNYLNTFWHENDKHTTTSKGYIWSLPGESTCAQKGIIVMPEHTMHRYEMQFNDVATQDCYGICSDYVEQIRDIVNETISMR